MTIYLKSIRASEIYPTSTPIKQKSVDLVQQVEKELEAIRLIELGARASLVVQLTALERPIIKRLYRQLVGKPSPAGQMPFTDAWYVKDDGLMLQASVFWKLYQQAESYE